MQRAHCVDDWRRHAHAHRPRRHDTGIVGRRHAALEWYLTTSEYPSIVDPKDGRIWTANAPVVDGPMLATSARRLCRWHPRALIAIA